jgi:hypothetical protein
MTSTVRRPDLPRDLRAVALIHLVFGVGALAEVLVRLSRSHVDLNFGVLGIPICFGLLRLSRSWRTCALVLLACAQLLAPIVFVIGLAGSSPATFGVLGIPIGQVPRAWVCVAAVGLFLLALWQQRVLVRPGVRQLFLADTAVSGSSIP